MVKCDNPECKSNKEATKVLRLITVPRNRVQAHLYFKKHIVCYDCALYLCNDSEFKYENEPNLKVEDIVKQRQNSISSFNIIKEGNENDGN